MADTSQRAEPQPAPPDAAQAANSHSDSAPDAPPPAVPQAYSAPPAAQAQDSSVDQSDAPPAQHGLNLLPGPYYQQQSASAPNPSSVQSEEPYAPLGGFTMAEVGGVGGLASYYFGGMAAEGVKRSSKGAKKKGSKGDMKQSAICEVCKIYCNTEVTLRQHKEGEKHKKKLRKLQESITPKPPKSPTTMTQKEGSNVDKGEKHEKKLQKQQESITPELPKAPTTMTQKEGSIVDKGEAVSKQTTKRTVPAAAQEFEAKIQRLLEGKGGTKRINVCTICNVVADSQKVYESHLTGKMHATMVKRQQAMQQVTSHSGGP